METLTRAQISSMSVCVSLRTNALGKDMNPYFLSSSSDKKLNRLISLVLVEKRMTSYPPTVLYLKIDLVSHPLHNGDMYPIYQPLRSGRV